MLVFLVFFFSLFFFLVEKVVHTHSRIAAGFRPRLPRLRECVGRLVPRGQGRLVFHPSPLRCNVRERLQGSTGVAGRVVHDVDGRTRAPGVIGWPHIHRQGEELRRGGCAGRGGADRVVIGDHGGRFHGSGIGRLGEGGGGQGGLDRTVDGGEGVDGGEVAGSGHGLAARGSVGLGGLDGGVGPRTSSEARAGGARDRGPRIGSLDAAGICAGDGRGRETAAFAVHAAVPPVLDGIVAAVAQAAGDLGPTLAHFIHHAFDQETLVGGDGLPVQSGLEVLVEAFPTLLGRAEVHMLRNAHPVVRALFTDELHKQLIFFGDPRATTVGRGHGEGVGEMRKRREDEG